MFRFRLLLIRFADLADRNPREQSYINNRHSPRRGAFSFSSSWRALACVHACVNDIQFVCVYTLDNRDERSYSLFCKGEGDAKMRGHKRRKNKQINEKILDETHTDREDDALSNTTRLMPREVIVARLSRAL